MREQPDQAPVLHGRASTWYERYGLPSAAIRHALAAGDFQRAASLIELETEMMRGGSQEATWKGWVQALPAELLRSRPVLSVYYAYSAGHRPSTNAFGGHEYTNASPRTQARYRL